MAVYRLSPIEISKESILRALMNVNWPVKYAGKIIHSKRSLSLESIWVRFTGRGTSVVIVGNTFPSENSWIYIYHESARTKRKGLSTSTLSMRLKLGRTVRNKVKNWERRMLNFPHHPHHHQAGKMEMIRKKIKILMKNRKVNLWKTLMKPGSWNCLKWQINASRLMKILRSLDSSLI
jgi:hypothetical protein